MKNIRKTLSHLLLLGLTVGCGFFAFSQKLDGFTANYAEGEQQAESQKRVYTAADFAGEEEANSEELAASIVQSTTTDSSQSLNISFRSKTLVGFKTGRGNYIVTITDPNFTGEPSSPVPEGYDKYDEDSGLPILEGVVSFVIGGGQNKEVCLPSTLTQAETFVIKVTGIEANCVTVNGEEYNGKNKWVDVTTVNGQEIKNPRITSIYIPNTIEHVAKNAFTGVPADVTIAYEDDSLPAGVFEDGWTDAANITYGTYKTKALKKANVGGTVEDMEDALGRPINFVLGCEPADELVDRLVAIDKENHISDELNLTDEQLREMYVKKCDRPLVIQYDKIKNGNRETIYEALPLTNTVGNSYDSVGKISSLVYSRLLGYKLGEGESIDDDSIIFHNIMKASNDSVIDTSKTYWVKPVIGYNEKQDLSHLVTFKSTGSSTFAGFSMFTLSMDKNLSITSDKYPEPHSLYLDVKQDLYEQNKLQIQKGNTVIRYSLYNLYLSSYHFIYEGSNGELKDITVPISTVISYQTLEHNKGNKVSILLENKKVAPDFSAEKVRTFELVNITIQMDLFATSDSGSTSVLGKSAISYKFAYITVRNDAKETVFNYNIFLIIFFVAYAALFAAGAFALYKVMKEKYKNDEFRRVDDKKYVKKALIYGAGSLLIVAAIVFIAMRVGGFANTIVVFNPTDPLLIIFSIVGMIVAGYFIVQAIKAIKVGRERRKAIRLKLNEDVDDDGTK